MMWEVMSYGERPYWGMSNQDVSRKLIQDLLGSFSVIGYSMGPSHCHYKIPTVIYYSTDKAMNNNKF